MHLVADREARLLPERENHRTCQRFLAGHVRVCDDGGGDVVGLFLVPHEIRSVDARRCAEDA